MVAVDDHRMCGDAHPHRVRSEYPSCATIGDPNTISCTGTPRTDLTCRSDGTYTATSDTGCNECATHRACNCRTHESDTDVGAGADTDPGAGAPSRCRVSHRP